MQTLAPGVHALSVESLAALQRAKEAYDKKLAKHCKQKETT